MIPRGSRVFTPEVLAEALVEALTIRKPATWLEPSYGAGVFVKAIAAAGYSRECIVALELSRAKLPDVEAKAQCLPGREALEWMRGSGRRFDAVVGNPPYASARGLTETLRRRLTQVRDPVTGGSLPLNSNLWLAFLIRAVGCLNSGGSLGFVLPASWDYAGYAEGVRNWLPDQFESFSVVRSDKPLFTGVTEGCVIIVGHNFGVKNRIRSRFECKDLSSTLAALSRLPTCWPAEEPSHPVASSGRTLRDVMELRLGGVAGHTSYFVMSEERRRKFGLPIASMKPVLTKARHLSQPLVDRAHWLALRSENEPVWLFRPSDSCVGHPKVAAYLERPPSRGGCDRHRVKVAQRVPWHRTPLPSGVHGFVSGVSARGVRISFLDFDDLSATNTLYVVRFKKGVSEAQRFGIGRWLLEERTQLLIRGKQRRYAGGLRKMEPGDILSLALPPTIPECEPDEYAHLFSVS